MVVSLKSWGASDYECDRLIASNNQAKNYKEGSATYKRYAISPELKLEAEKNAKSVTLLDIPSQIGKCVLEILLWPVTFIGFLGYAVISLPMNLYKGKFDATETVMSAALGFFYAPASAMNRIRLIAMDCYGLYDPEAAAESRHEAYSSFPCHGQSLLRFLGNVATGDPFGMGEDLGDAELPESDAPEVFET